MDGARKRRLQSAMEYLMTYGWAILAVAIVMVSLYSLGIFNTGSLQPTATPGSCKVVRTTAQTSLAGQCNNLIPKYTAKFNGINSYIGIAPETSITSITGNVISLEAWAYLAQIHGNGEIISNEPTGGGFYIWVDTTNHVHFGYNHGTGEITSSSINTNSWYQFVGTYNGTTLNLYINGVSITPVPSTSSINKENWTFIGGYGASATSPSTSFFNGSVSNVQIYNVSLDNLSAKALYQEGIGGSPIDVSHIVAWWPLNGNANDYSGNNNQGTSTNVNWNANWQSGYAVPTT